MKKYIFFTILFFIFSYSKAQEYYDYDAFDEIELKNEVQSFKLKAQKQEQKPVFLTPEKQKQSKFEFLQSTKQSKNEYMNDEYKAIMGGVYKPFKYVNISSGLESNYRAYDQYSTKKVFFNPSIKISEKVSIDFLNKLNVQNRAQSHDLGLKISPFKSKRMDFGLYTGINKNQAGVETQNINFSTNFLF